MSIIERISYNISNRIGTKANKSKDEIEVIKYGLFMAIHSVTAIIITIIVGIILGRLKEMLLITLVAASLKRCSGGVHATSPNRCLIIGIIISIVFTYISVGLSVFMNLKMALLFSIIILIICNFIFYKKAPVGTKNKPLKKEATRKRLRKKLFKTLSVYYFIIFIFFIGIFNKVISYEFINVIYCIELGILLQCLALTKLGESTILKLDSILIYKN